MSDDTDAAGQTNRLAAEKSPYLLQHAQNPVDWYPWGEEAIERARSEDRPIFLSIGYSTCHWCHVMERESFENEAIAALLNRYYVAIKVDREERPDVDRVYMSAVQAITGAGGWPLSAWLTPDLEPYFAGTYFPPERRHGQPGFADVLIQLRRAWDEQREEVLSSSRQITEAVQKMAAAPSSEVATEVSLQKSMQLAFERFAGSFDADNGGFGTAPKFPRPSVFDFLHLYAEVENQPDALVMCSESLRKMWAGGINDHLAGGFHRYSVDARWRVPHFEKMLYDQAQLASSFLDAGRLTDDAFFAHAARDIFRYVEHDLSSPEGAFFSAEDADSADESGDVREGAFYLWELDEVAETVGDELPLVKAAFGLRSEGNTLHDPQGELGTSNFLYSALHPTVLSLEFGDSTTEAKTRLQAAKERLLERRSLRTRPHRDDKVIVAWNGLMISALARGAALLQEPRWALMARRAADFLLSAHEPGATLRRRYRDGDWRYDAQLEDHAGLALGILDLYEATLSPELLVAARLLTEQMLSHFSPEEGGALYDSPAGDEHLLVRSRSASDGAEPSGNALACELLARLGALLHHAPYTEAARGIVRTFSAVLESQPQAAPRLLASAAWASNDIAQVVLSGPLESAPKSELFQTFWNVRPRFSVLLHVDGPTRELLRSWDHVAAEMQPLAGQLTAYVCRDFTCEAPVNAPGDLRAQLG
ncbi:MAG: thioredoxin domain-containing protein [Acidobacteriota bacterium]